MKFKFVPRVLILLANCLLLLEYPAPSGSASAPALNPFFTESTLPFHTPPFDKIKDTDYAPAIEEGMKGQLAEIEKIANNPAPPTFANTFEAMERSGALLTRVTKVFFNLTQSNTNDTLQKIKSDEAPKLAAHSDAVFLNAKLFARVKALYDKRNELKLDDESRFLIERYYKTFVRAGALLSEADKETLRGLNQEEAKLTTKFEDDVLAEVNDSAVIIDNKADLDGLSESDIAAAAERAKERGMTGKWVLALQNTTQQPAISLLKNRAVRERLFQASVVRGNHGGAHDTKASAKLTVQTDRPTARVNAIASKILGNARKLLTTRLPKASTVPRM